MMEPLYNAFSSVLRLHFGSLLSLSLNLAFFFPVCGVLRPFCSIARVSTHVHETSSCFCFCVFSILSKLISDGSQPFLKISFPSLISERVALYLYNAISVPL